MLSKVREADGTMARTFGHRRGPLVPAAFLLSMLLVGGCAQPAEDDGAKGNG
ncbi:hypothetical protein [Streptomyces sp. NPDC091027]|uniref:hypothetical protein n=1 Tax=Streptomyces sp. NPDC091027 TaxID=3365971 RepID=UPI0038192963